MDSGSNPGPPGRSFGRYVLLEAIDRGGMAEVYRAVTQGPAGFQRQFVIKRIRKEKAASRDFVEMFVNEARISALLEHPNIVQVYDFGQVDGDYFLAMEYLRGRNLLQVGRRLRKERLLLPPDLTAYVAREVARGLHYAHTLSNMGEPLGIVHRDVSPSNIMLLKTGGVKLLDFGIARATMKLRSLTPIGGLIKGKLAYLSPEQIRGHGIDGRSDVFSLGVVLFEALTGVRLFFHPNDLDTMRNVLHRPIPKPSELRAEIPAAIDAVVLRALQRDPAQRFPDAGAMASELDEHLREARFSPESVVTLLGDLFGDEDSGRELPLPEEALLAPRATGSRNQISSGLLAPPAIAQPPEPEEDEQGYATVSAVHRLAALATQQRRRRFLQAGGLASVAIGAIGLFAVAQQSRPAPSNLSRPWAPPAAVVAAAARASNPAMPGAKTAAGTSGSAPGSHLPGVPGGDLGTAPTSQPGPDLVPLPHPTPARVAGNKNVGSTGGKNASAIRESSTANTAAANASAMIAARGKRTLASGLSALQSGEYMRAAAQLEEAALAVPNNHEALAALAEAEFELARYSLAVRHARRAAALVPRNPRYQALLGDSFFKLRRYREAAQAYGAAVAASPHEASLRERKARVEALLGSRDEVQPGDDKAGE